jgi:hypothetical protein
MKNLTHTNSAEDPYSDTFFYRLPLENENFILTKETLERHLPASIKLDRAMNKLHNEFLSYRAGVLCIGLKHAETTVYKIYLGFADDVLYVGCQCGMPDRLLCIHAYKGLMTFIDRKSGSFKPYFWPGYEPDGNGSNKFLDINVKWHDIEISPKMEFGNLFIKKRGFEFENQIIIDPLRSKLSHRKQGNQPILGYHFLYNANRSSISHLPLILPFIGSSNKNDSDINSYDFYLWKNGVLPNDIHLTNDQITLNSICFQLFEIASLMQVTTKEGEYSNELQRKMLEMFKHWKLAIPLLIKEPYVKGSYSLTMRSIGSRPRKKDARDLQFFADSLKIDILIKEEEDHFTVEPLISTYEKDISENYLKLPLFVNDPKGGNYDHFHLIDNLQDESILEWFSLSKGKLTILKDDFEEFWESFASKLNDYYVVYFLAFKCKKKVRWNNRIPTITGYFQQSRGEY